MHTWCKQQWTRMTHLNRLYYVEVQLLAFNSYNFHLMCYRRNTGQRNQQRQLKWQRDGTQQDGVVLVLRSVLVSVVCWAAFHPPAPLTLTMWWIRAVNKVLYAGQPRPRHSTRQGKDIRIMRVPVMALRNMNMNLIIEDIIFKSVSS